MDKKQGWKPFETKYDPMSGLPILEIIDPSMTTFWIKFPDKRELYKVSETRKGGHVMVK